ncbi:unnamed protein product [Soboliphyme baturini]|uniref:Protein kinase domain-containing protein n=1 Tax=Soboliphyme baturini TaxID=241478 RepID=A0A183J3I7_9BILA|nr:unnamed protein product [Soboliphyme baturini]
MRLPLAYSTLSIIGRFQFLKQLDHPHLCAYLDIQRGKYDWLYIVSEHYCTTISSLMNLDDAHRRERIPQIAFEILSGLNYLHQNGIVNGFLCPENVLLNSKGWVKLSHFGLYHLSDKGKNVTFPIGDPFYSAPEMYGNADGVPHSRKCDVWSFALIILELVLERIKIRFSV